MTSSAISVVIASATLAVLLITATPSAFAQRPSEVEGARANARAGGPTNARDAELLDRYGALSGTVKRDWRTGRELDRSERFERRHRARRED